MRMCVTGTVRHRVNETIDQWHMRTAEHRDNWTVEHIINIINAQNYGKTEKKNG